MLEGSEQLLTWNESRAQCRKVSRVHFRLVGLIQSKSSAMTGHWEWGNCLRFEIGTYQESETCAPKSIAANFWSDIPVIPAGHYGFLPPCSPRLAANLPRPCSDPPGFDRTAFHRDFDASVVGFFREHLVGGETR